MSGTVRVSVRPDEEGTGAHVFQQKQFMDAETICARLQELHGDGTLAQLVGRDRIEIFPAANYKLEEGGQYVYTLLRKGEASRPTAAL